MADLLESDGGERGLHDALRVLVRPAEAFILQLVQLVLEEVGLVVVQGFEPGQENIDFETGIQDKRAFIYQIK